MQYILRPATNEDRADIEQLVFDALREHGLEPDSANTDSDLLDIQTSYFAGGGTFDLLMNDSGQIVARCDAAYYLDLQSEEDAQQAASGDGDKPAN